jgi:hypothetical protein
VAETVPSEITDGVPCARCGGNLQVRYCSFDLDLPVVALCALCLYGPGGIYDPECGDGSFLRSAADHLDQRGDEHDR